MNDTIRKLAKKTENQNILYIVKEIPSLKIFKNERDLSYIQNIYLSYSFMYKNLTTDIELKKVNEIVLDDFIYEDAYLYWKKNKKDKDDNKKKTTKGRTRIYHNNKIKFPKRDK